MSCTLDRSSSPDHLSADESAHNVGPMTPKTRRYLVLFAAAIAVVALATYANHWYHANIGWPRDIQTHLFGQELASHQELASREFSYTFLGQGLFRWTYRIRPDNARVQTLCRSEPLEVCRSTKSMRLQPHVTLDAELHNGFLTLEEWWD
jgi:hypothetical protein